MHDTSNFNTAWWRRCAHQASHAKAARRKYQNGHNLLEIPSHRKPFQISNLQHDKHARPSHAHDTPRTHWDTTTTTHSATRTRNSGSHWASNRDAPDAPTAGPLPPPAPGSNHTRTRPSQVLPTPSFHCTGLEKHVPRCKRPSVMMERREPLYLTAFRHSRGSIIDRARARTLASSSSSSSSVHMYNATPRPWASKLPGLSLPLPPEIKSASMLWRPSFPGQPRKTRKNVPFRLYTLTSPPHFDPFIIN